MINEYVICKYIRLSVEDSANDSLSVENQRLLLDRHIAGMDIPGAMVMEFVDNGHSGMNFDRPAVQELLELARQGRVNCIIVKDISRFGRNMIDTGYYIERVFPLYRVRFISVSDTHDSADFDGDTGGMELALKFLLHEQYSKDLSKKIKSARRAKASRGEYVVKNCLFGYKKVGNRLEIDEPAAETIRLIFSMAADGLTLARITARLYAGKRPTPKEYRQLSRQELKKESACLWGKPQILDILSNEQYTGTYIAGKTKTLVIGSGKTVKTDESEWIKIPDHHPAIISKEVFNAVKRNTGKKGEPSRKRKLGTAERYKNIYSPLERKVTCGCCGHKMVLSSTRNAAFHCDFTRSAPDSECYRLKSSASVLESIVMESTREQARAILESESGPISLPGHSTGYEERIAILWEAKQTLYEKFVLGEISTDNYKLEKASLDADFDKTKKSRAASVKESANRAVFENLRRIAGDALKEESLSRRLVDTLIDKVFVYPGDRMDIVWKITAVDSG